MDPGNRKWEWGRGSGNEKEEVKIRKRKWKYLGMERNGKEQGGNGKERIE
jgi:hypothetical protein